MIKLKLIFVTLITLLLLSVMAAPAFADPGKVRVCHNGNVISVSHHAVAAHLAHGDNQRLCRR